MFLYINTFEQLLVKTLHITTIISLDFLQKQKSTFKNHFYITIIIFIKYLNSNEVDVVVVSELIGGVDYVGYKYQVVD